MIKRKLRIKAIVKKMTHLSIYLQDESVGFRAYRHVRLSP